MTKVKVTVENLNGEGGLFATPVWVAAHDGSFDTFSTGEAASEGLERLAEDGSVDQLREDFDQSEAGTDGVIVGNSGVPGIIDPNEVASTILDVDALNDRYFSYASMVIPSNDAFVANGNPLAFSLFDENGNFNAPEEIIVGERVYDAGTEVNNELEAAFINQTGPDRGVDENGVVTLHEGFIGSEGNPTGDPIILGGTNAAGFVVNPDVADFSVDGFEFLRFTFSEIEEILGDGENNSLRGTRGDDSITGSDGDDTLNGTAGDDTLDGGNDEDLLSGGSGNDVLFGGNGNDTLFGNSGSDVLNGGEGDDNLSGARGNDALFGNEGNDTLSGNSDDDTLYGGEGDDNLSGGRDNDELIGDAGNDELNGNSGDDLLLGGEGNDTLYGTSGNDTLDGGLGVDELIGGSGADVFIHEAGDGTSIVQGFTQGLDLIQLSFEGVNSYADLVATADSVTRASGVTTIEVDSDNILTVTADLEASDFVFV